MAFKKILIAIDSEPVAAHAADLAAELARRLGAEMAFIHVVELFARLSGRHGCRAERIDRLGETRCEKAGQRFPSTSSAAISRSGVCPRRWPGHGDRQGRGRMAGRPHRDRQSRARRSAARFAGKRCRGCDASRAVSGSGHPGERVSLASGANGPAPQSVADVVTALGSNRETGLASAEAASRLERDGSNEVAEKKIPSCPSLQYSN